MNKKKKAKQTKNLKNPAKKNGMIPLKSIC